MADILTFDPIKHIYSLDGRYMSGVSSILKKAGLVDLSGIPQDVLERARDFGIKVHLACELYDLGTLDMKSLAEPLMPYLQAWRKFKTDTGIEIKGIEEAVRSKKWWYAGRFDRAGIARKKNIILDLKSSSTIYPSMKIQLAAYQIAYEEMYGKKIKERWIVQLKGNGTYQLHVYDDPTHLSIFLACVQISKFKRREKEYYDRNKSYTN